MTDQVNADWTELQVTIPAADTDLSLIHIFMGSVNGALFASMLMPVILRKN